jgi:hypothetical protein
MVIGSDYFEETNQNLSPSLRHFGRFLIVKSESTLKELVCAKVLELVPVLATSPVLNERLALILLASEDFKLTIKAFYEQSEWRTYLMKHRSGQFHDSLVHDYLKEVCNQFGGIVKRAFLEEGKVIGLSLPLCTRGFDEIFYETDPASNVILWAFKEEGMEITFRAELRLANPEDQNLLMRLNTDALESEATLDFL